MTNKKLVAGLRAMPVVIVVITVFGVLLIGSVCLYNYSNGVENAYALEWVSLMLVEHIKHKGQWPSDWSELRDDYRRVCEEQGYTPWSFGQLRKRVEIDFSTDITTIQQSDRDSVRILTCKSGTQLELQMPTPNGRIWDYLQQHSTVKGGASPANFDNQDEGTARPEAPRQSSGSKEEKN